VRALPQILIKGDMSTEKSGPRLRPHFTPEPRRWIRPFGAPLPYCRILRGGALIAPGTWPRLNSIPVRASIIAGALFDSIRLRSAFAFMIGFVWSFVC
jgi:hypothetical protein